MRKRKKKQRHAMLVKLWLCEDCLDGVGEECHTAQCAFCWHRSLGHPVMPELYKVLRKVVID